MFFKSKVKNFHKKIPKSNSDDMDFDFDFDSNDDFGSDLFNESTSKKRSAITRVSKGLIKGAKKKVLNPKFYKEEILKHLPDTVTDSVSVVEDLASTITDEFRLATRELKPELAKTAYSINALIPSKYKRTKHLANKAYEKLKVEDSFYGTPSAERSREENISSELRTIFAQQKANSDYQEKKEDIIRGVEQKISVSNHQANQQIFNQMNQGIALTNAYNLKVNTAYQKKSLELQFRSYYVQADMLRTMREDNTAFKEMMAGILKNTGLPDYVKLTEGERFKASLKNQLFDGINNKILDKANFWKRTVGNIKSSFQIKTANAKDFMEGPLGMALDAMSQMLEMGSDPMEEMGSTIGGFGAGYFGSKLLKRVFNKYAPKDSKIFGKAVDYSNLIQNPSELVKVLKNSNLYQNADYNPSIFKGGLGKILKTIVDAMPDNSFNSKINLKESAQTLLKPAIYNGAAQNSIVKIIPGYLARILQQSEKIGNLTDAIAQVGYKIDTRKMIFPELLVYDAEGNKFTTHSQLAKSINDRFNSAADIAGISSAKKNVVRSIMETSAQAADRANLYKSMRVELSNFGSDVMATLKLAKEGLKGKAYKDTLDNLSSQAINIKDNIEDYEKKYFQGNEEPDRYEFQSIQMEVNDFISTAKRALTSVGFSGQTERNISIFDEKTKKIKKKKITGSVDEIVGRRENRDQDIRNRTDKLDKIEDYEGYQIYDRLVDLMSPLNFDTESYIDPAEAIQDKEIKKRLIDEFGNDAYTKVKADINAHVNDHTRRSSIGSKFSTLTSKLPEMSTYIQNLSEVGVEPSLFRQAGLTKDAYDNYGNKETGVYNFAKGFLKEGIAKFRNESTLNEKIDKIRMKLGSDSRAKEMFNNLIQGMSGNKKESIVNKLASIDSTSKLIEYIEKLNTKDESPYTRSDKALKTNIRPVNKNNYRIGSTTQAFANIDVPQWSYKYDKQNTHIGPMAQDVQKAFGDAAAPGGKRIDITSMLGLLSKGVGDLKKEALIREHILAHELGEVRKDLNKYFVTTLSLRGIDGSTIKSIFDSTKSTVGSISGKVSQFAKRHTKKARSFTSDAYERILSDDAKDSIENNIQITHDKFYATRGRTLGENFTIGKKKLRDSVQTARQKSSDILKDLKLGSQSQLIKKISTKEGLRNIVESIQNKAVNLYKDGLSNEAQSYVESHIDYILDIAKNQLTSEQKNYLIQKKDKLKEKVKTVPGIYSKGKERFTKEASSFKDKVYRSYGYTKKKINEATTKLRSDQAQTPGGEMALALKEAIEGKTEAERTQGLKSFLIDLFAGTVGGTGYVARKVNDFTLMKLYKVGKKYTDSIKGVSCNSNVYLNGKFDHPVLIAANYTTNDVHKMYFNAKLDNGILAPDYDKRVISACHVKGPVFQDNQLLITPEQVKEGLYVLDANGKPMKLNGLRHMSAVLTNAALKVGKKAANKLWNNHLSKYVRKLSNKLPDSWLGKKLKLDKTRDIISAAGHTFMGDNQLTPLLSEWLTNKGGANKPGVLGKTANKVKGFLGKNIFDIGKPADTNPTDTKDMVIYDPDIPGANLKKTKKKQSSIFNRFINLAIDKKHPVRSIGIITAAAAALPTLAPIIGAYAAGKLFYKAVKLDLKQEGLLGMKNRVATMKKGANIAASAALVPFRALKGTAQAVAHSTGRYGAGKIKSIGDHLFNLSHKKENESFNETDHLTDAELEKHYRKIFHKIHPDFGGDTKSFIDARNEYKKVKEHRSGMSEKGIQYPIKSKSKEDKKNFDDLKKHMLDSIHSSKKKFYQTMVNGRYIRKGGVRDMEYEKKDHAKKEGSKLIDIIKQHKSGGSMGIMGLIGAGISGLMGLVGHVVGGIKMVGSILGDVKDVLAGGFSGLASIFGKGLSFLAKGLLSKGGAVAAAGAAGYALGHYIVNPAINKATQDLSGGKYKTLGQATYHGVQDAKRFLEGKHQKGHYSDLRESKNVPIGIKYNNPGYIRKYGKYPIKNGIVIFPNPVTGLMSFGLLAKSHVQNKQNTLTLLLNELELPSFVKDPADSVLKIAVQMGINPKDILNFDDKDIVNKFLVAVIVNENGKMYYSSTIINGIAKDVASIKNKIIPPVTIKEKSELAKAKEEAKTATSKTLQAKTARSAKPIKSSSVKIKSSSGGLLVAGEKALLSGIKSTLGEIGSALGVSFKSVTAALGDVEKYGKEAANYASHGLSYVGGKAEKYILSGFKDLKGDFDSVVKLVSAYGISGLTAFLESRGDPAVVSGGQGDYGGRSYGTFQLSSSPQSDGIAGFLGYIKNTAQGKYLIKSGSVDSPEFISAWKHLANTNPQFNRMQASYNKVSYYEPCSEYLKNHGCDLTDKKIGVQCVIDRTANQFGPESGAQIILTALHGQDISKLSSDKVISLIEDHKLKHLNTFFSGSSPQEREGVARGLIMEKKFGIQLNSGKVAISKNAINKIPPKTNKTVDIKSKVNHKAIAADAKRSNASKTPTKAKAIVNKNINTPIQTNKKGTMPFNSANINNSIRSTAVSANERYTPDQVVSLLKSGGNNVGLPVHLSTNIAQSTKITAEHAEIQTQHLKSMSEGTKRLHDLNVKQLETQKQMLEVMKNIHITLSRSESTKKKAEESAIKEHPNNKPTQYNPTNNPGISMNRKLM